MLRAIYVDDGRLVIEKLGIGVRFVDEKKAFQNKDIWIEEEKVSGISLEERREKEVSIAMNSISENIQIKKIMMKVIEKKRLREGEIRKAYVQETELEIERG